MPAAVTAERYTYIFDLLCAELGPLTGKMRARALGAEVATRRLTKASRRLYAAAVRFCLEGNGEELAIFNKALEAAPKDEAPKVRKQSLLIPDGLFETMLEILDDNSDRWSRAQPLKALIMGVRHFGLRPVEWENAEWANEERSTLLVKNAKYADTVISRGPNTGAVWRRGNGEYRELEIAEEHGEVMRQIADNAMAAIQEFPYSDEINSATFRRTHKWALQVAVAEYDYPSKIIENVTVYSYRHAFSSDAKACFDITDGEVAALMGHISTSTAVTSYARKTARSGGLKIQPSANSIERVKVRDVVLLEDYRKEKEAAKSTSKETTQKPQNPSPSM